MKDLRKEIARKAKVKRELSDLEKILDENNEDNIFLEFEQVGKVEFQQVTLLDFDEKLYSILTPVKDMPGVKAGEGILFEIEESTGKLTIIDDQNIIDNVLDFYMQETGKGEK